MSYTRNDLKIIPTILCGGEGSRLWPLSRAEHPKQFLLADDSESFLEKAFLRGANVSGIEEVLTLTSGSLFSKVKSSYDQLGRDHIKRSFLVEPCARNTAAAIASAAYLMKELFSDDAILLVLPSDQLIKDQKAFEDAVEKAIELAHAGRLVTFGIRPDFPATGYGYIEADGSDVARFIEKPPLEDAEAFLASGNFLWNSGMFCFRAGTLLEQMQDLCPDVLEVVEQSVDAGHGERDSNPRVWNLNAESYSQVQSTSIDYAVMEKTQVASVVPCDIGWSDVGCWKSYGELFPADENGNHISGNVVTHDSTNCTVNAGDRLVGTVGLENIIISDTSDALLVASKDSTQGVKELYKKVKERDGNEYKEHATVKRPWGSYTVLEEGAFHKVKNIEVLPGAKLSLQSHEHRSEHWVVVQGKAKVVNGDQELILSTQDHTFIPARCKHRLENIGDELLVVLEVQTGNYLGEDDIRRYEDQYGRAEAA